MEINSIKNQQKKEVNKIIKKKKLYQSKKIEKNSFSNININIKFKSYSNFKFNVKKKMIKKFNKYINFKEKSQKEKIEILLNNYLNIKLNNNQNKNKSKCDLIGCGYNHFFILNKNTSKKQDKLFLFGDHNNNTITQNLKTFNIEKIFIHSLVLPKIKKFKNGNFHNLILFENGDLFSFGSNYECQCGFLKTTHI